MKKLLTIIATLSLLAVAGVGTARAQVDDALVVNIPFEFNVGNTTLPAGNYTVKPFGTTNESLMAIVSDEGKVLRVFPVIGAQTLKPPERGELIFHRMGDHYFLDKVFDPSNPLGAELPKTRAERRLEKEEVMAGGSSTVTVVAVNAASRR